MSEKAFDADTPTHLELLSLQAGRGLGRDLFLWSAAVLAEELQSGKARGNLAKKRRLEQKSHVEKQLEIASLELDFFAGVLAFTDSVEYERTLIGVGWAGIVPERSQPPHLPRRVLLGEVLVNHAYQYEHGIEARIAEQALADMPEHDLWVTAYSPGYDDPANNVLSNQFGMRRQLNSHAQVRNPYPLGKDTSSYNTYMALSVGVVLARIQQDASLPDVQMLDYLV